MAVRPTVDPRLGRLIKSLELVGSQSARAQLSQRMGREMLSQIRHQIEQSRDPYGRPWPPRVDDGAPALRGLANAFSAGFTAAGPNVGTSKWYAAVHQTGKRIAAKAAPNLRFRLPSGRWVSKRKVTIPRRQIVPTLTGGLGPYWGPALQRVADEFFRDHLRGR